MQALEVLARPALAIAGGQQLALVGPALAGVEHRRAHQVRLARRIAHQHGVHQHGQPPPSAATTSAATTSTAISRVPCMRSSGT
jgi:hypothetical protein